MPNTKYNYNYFQEMLEMFRKERGQEEPSTDDGYIAKLNKWRSEREKES